jgi:hypothetical protein
MPLIKNPTIKDFEIPPTTVSWKEIERVLGKRRFSRFEKYMYGQTVGEHGVYVDDLVRFLRGLPVID